MIFRTETLKSCLRLTLTFWKKRQLNTELKKLAPNSLLHILRAKFNVLGWGTLCPRRPILADYVRKALFFLDWCFNGFFFNCSACCCELDWLEAELLWYNHLYIPIGGRDGGRKQHEQDIKIKYNALSTLLEMPD